MSLNSNLTTCLSPDNSYTFVQTFVRVYLGIPLVVVGLLTNAINIRVFAHSTMRRSHVNWMLTALAMSDMCVLMTSFCMLTLPVLSEMTANWKMYTFSQYAIAGAYPLGMTVHTFTVYMTITISLHRYLGVTHPLKMRLWATDCRVAGCIVLCAAFSIMVNITRWFELAFVQCEFYEEETSWLMGATKLYMDETYFFWHNKLLYFIIMFAIPFTISILVNSLILRAIKSSSTLRRTLTVSRAARIRHVVVENESIGSARLAVADSAVSRNRVISTNSRSSADLQANREATRERSTTIMLLAIVALFLLCNSLAFVCNFLSPSFVMYTSITEVSNLLVTVNSSATFGVYYVFGTKYRTLCKEMLHNFFDRIMRVNTSEIRLNSAFLSVTPVGTLVRQKSTKVTVPVPTANTVPISVNIARI